ncbi:hypothetical protein I33_1921 [Bacillus subtilis subsp. subtilis str. RO-NN-1]|nr:hypothetical protein I33_1921 [Bacillus subtilis subsp. subtilis str. RO-NN-1]
MAAPIDSEHMAIVRNIYPINIMNSPHYIFKLEKTSARKILVYAYV